MTLPEARKVVGQSLGLPAFNDPADLTASQREELYDALARFIIGNNGEFDVAAYTWAEKRIDSNNYRVPLPSYGPLDAAKSFAGEFVRQAGEVASLRNPFASKLVLGLAIGGGLYLAVKVGVLGKALKAVKS